MRVFSAAVIHPSSIEPVISRGRLTKWSYTLRRRLRISSSVYLPRLVHIYLLVVNYTDWNSTTARAGKPSIGLRAFKLFGKISEKTMNTRLDVRLRQLENRVNVVVPRGYLDKR